MSFFQPQSLGNNVYAERTINVELIDVNDNIPVFENTDDNGYVIGSVDENTTVINTEVVTVKAYDSDITPAFKTVSSPTMNMFVITCHYILIPPY